MNAEKLTEQMGRANLDMETRLGKAGALTWSLRHALNDNSPEGANAAVWLAECLAETLAPKRRGR